MRLNKYIASSGFSSRRKAEEYILNGRVRINGNIVKDLSTQIDVINDVVTIDNKILHSSPSNQKIYLMFNKPKGCICSASDEKGRKTIFDIINLNVRLFSVGRLDYNTEGLLLLTNDGDLAYKLAHPSFDIEKTYIARIKGLVTESEINLLRQGVIIDKKNRTKPAKIKIMEKSREETKIEITISEGKNRQIHKMFEAIKKEVKSLKRISFGSLNLSGVSRGKCRDLSKNEINDLHSLLK